MTMDDALEIIKPDQDSHFRLLPCRRCRSDNVAYVKYQHPEGDRWRAECFGCGATADPGSAIRHLVQQAWNAGYYTTGKEKTMQRLTERRGGQVNYTGKHSKLPGLDCASTMRVAAIREVMDRLADYEEIGLSPEEIKNMLPQLRSTN